MATAARVDAHEQTLIEDQAKKTSNVLIEFGETKHTPRSDAEMLTAADIMHIKLLEQKQCVRSCARYESQNGWDICRIRKKDSQIIGYVKQKCVLG